MEDLEVSRPSDELVVGKCLDLIEGLVETIREPEPEEEVGIVSQFFSACSTVRVSVMAWTILAMTIAS